MNKFAPSRRRFLSSALAGGTLSLLPWGGWARAQDALATGPSAPFSFDLLKDMARDVASRPFAPMEIKDFDLLESIDYDLHNQIRYKSEDILWKDRPQGPAVSFFFPGRYFKEPVHIYAVEDGMAREIPFSTDLFDIPEKHPALGLDETDGFAGFRVMESADQPDWMAFLGAAYFRTAGYSGQFGLSARGLALDTAASGPEEFPRFTRFWLEPEQDGEIIIYALMESPSVTGAYRIASTRKDGIIQDIDAKIFLRNGVERLGIAPMTSMFWFGKHNDDIAPDWRPEVHDSDGLEIHTGSGERIWRPLNNPPRAMTNSFSTENPVGFGLMQRERDFAEYQDDGVFYDKRASLWVEPKTDWGTGEVMLVELTTNDEIHDNIVAFWRPEGAAAAGNEYEMSYRLHWVRDNPEPLGLARFVATRIGAGGIPGQPRPANVVRIVCDLEGRGFEGLGRPDNVSMTVNASSGSISRKSVYPVVSTDRWRAAFDLDIGPERKTDDPVDLRIFVHHEGKAMSETLILQLFPSQLYRLLNSRA